MSITEIKLRIINRITTIEDELVLKEIVRLLDLEVEMESIYQLTNKERKAIKTGLKHIKEGKIYSSKEANNIIKELLKKSGLKPPSELKKNKSNL